MVSFKQVAFLLEPSSPQRKAVYAADAMEGGGRVQTTPSKFKGWVLRRRSSRPHATTHLLAPYRSAVAAAVQHAYAALYYHLLCRRMARKAVAAHPTAVAAAVLGALMLCCYLLFASHSAFRCGWQALVLRLRVDFNCLTVCVFCKGLCRWPRPL